MRVERETANKGATSLWDIVGSARFLSTLFLIFTTVLITSPVLAQAQHNATGQLFLTTTRGPVPAAYIPVELSSKQWRYGTQYTDRDGWYFFRGIQSGAYVLSIWPGQKGQINCSIFIPEEPLTVTLPPATIPGCPGGKGQPPAALDVQIEFRARKSLIVAGESTSLFFAIRNGQSARIDPDVGPLDATELQKGERVVSPKQTTVYTLTVVGIRGQTIRQQILVRVQSASPAVSDDIRIISVSPPLGTTLRTSDTISFEFRIHYNLATVDEAKLVVSIAVSDLIDRCSRTAGELVTAGEAKISRGQGNASVRVTWEVGTLGKGRFLSAGTAAPAPSLWRVDRFERIRYFGVSSDYCYVFAGR